MSLKRPAVSIILTIFFLSRLTAGEFYVTGVRQYKDAGQAGIQMQINNAIVIKDISIFGEGRSLSSSFRNTYHKRNVFTLS